ncbi:MAG: permease-like cell division protein FtsX [Clostridia bacterium]|nr:permease-like cell division protein FtsX [Clostridia bacterium]
MSRFRLFTFIKDGFKGVFRNGLMSVASILVLFSSLLLIGIFTTLIKNVNFNLEKMDDFNELVCYMELDTDDETLEKAEQDIWNLDNVTNVLFVSKEEALEQERLEYGEEYAFLFDMYNTERANPLPDAFRIEYESVSKLDALEYQLEKVQGVQHIRNSREIAINIEKFKNIITIGGGWLMLLLVVVSLFVISNTIKLTFHSRELEISIMRYIGATKFYITMPFVVESIIISLVASAIGYGLQWYIYTFLVEKIAIEYNIISIVPFSQMNNLFLIIFFGAGLFIGVFGGAITIRKYMKV